MKIFLDDKYDSDRKSMMPAGYIGAGNFVEFRKLFEDALSRSEKIEAISFDNDLGDQKDGWEIAKWLTEQHPEIFADNPELTIHSANPAGRENLKHYIELGQKHYKELIEAKDRPDPWAENKNR